MPPRAGGPPWRPRTEHRFAPEKHVLLHDAEGVCVATASSVSAALAMPPAHRSWNINATPGPSPAQATAHGPPFQTALMAGYDLRRAARIVATSYPSPHPQASADEVWALHDAGRLMAQDRQARHPSVWHVPADIARRALALRAERGAERDRGR